MMQQLEHYFTHIDPVFAAFLATTFTWLVTAAGASLVFFFKNMHLRGEMTTKNNG